MVRFYSMVAILGLMTVPASVMLGFRHDPNAPAANFLFNIGLFIAYMTVHIVMLLPAFKKAVYGQPRSTQRERRVFILVSVITWVILYAVHKPVPGFAFAAPLWVQYVGACGVFLGFLMFYEGVTFGFIDAFIGMPGTELSHSADTSTPLMTEGSYARVRHPMYRGAVTYLLFSLLIHPQAGQLLFVVIIALGFVLFIPFEERGLLKARGDEYTVYMQTVRYRVFPGIW